MLHELLRQDPKASAFYRSLRPSTRQVADENAIPQSLQEVKEIFQETH